MYKYMRIQGREDSYITKYPKGIFSLCWNLVRDKKLTPEEEKLFVSCKNHETVITFFKCDSTGFMLEKLQPAIDLLDKYDKPYDVVYTNFVGTVVYEDEWQIAVSVQDGKMV